MILTVTFNPALDVSGVVENLVPNEKSYVFDEVHMPGGNGINAGIIAHRLGAYVELSGFLGGANGEEIRELLKKETVDHEFIPIKGRTRMNLTVSNRHDHQQTRLSFPGPEIRKLELKKIEEKIKTLTDRDILVLGGSLPPGVNPSCVLKLVKLAGRKNIKTMVDMPGYLLREVIEGKPLFIKPNLIEFQGLTGKKVTSIKGVMTEAKKLLNKVPLICVSSVEGGALLISKREVWFGKIPPVKIYSSVGAGDSMVGAMASLLKKNNEVSGKDLMQIGLAASCATLTEKGLTLGSEKEIHKYLPQIFLKKILSPFQRQK